MTSLVSLASIVVITGIVLAVIISTTLLVTLMVLERTATG